MTTCWHRRPRTETHCWRRRPGGRQSCRPDGQRAHRRRHSGGPHRGQPGRRKARHRAVGWIRDGHHRRPPGRRRQSGVRRVSARRFRCGDDGRQAAFLSRSRRVARRRACAHSSHRGEPLTRCMHEPISRSSLRRCQRRPRVPARGCRGPGTGRALASDSVGVCDSASCARFGIDGAL